MKPLVCSLRHLIALWLTISVIGCTSHRQYQPPHPGVKVIDPRLKVQSPTGTLAVIKFDEQGDFFDIKQLRAATAMIEDIEKPLLITFFHGWRHDAREDDRDLIQFKRFIDQVNKSKPSGFTACGVYIGW